MQNSLYLYLCLSVLSYSLFNYSTRVLLSLIHMNSFSSFICIFMWTIFPQVIYLFRNNKQWVLLHVHILLKCNVTPPLIRRGSNFFFLEVLYCSCLGFNALLALLTKEGGNKLLPENQHGFRQKRSTMTALTSMQKEWVKKAFLNWIELNKGI